MVDEPAFDYIDELVIAAGISGQDEEPRVNQIADGVIDDSFHNLAIAELKAHPDTMDDGGAGVEVEMIADRVAVKTIDIENGLYILDRDLFNNIGFEASNPEGLERGLGSMVQQFFDGVPGGRLQVTFMVREPNWITTFSDLVALVSIMSCRSFSLRPSSVLDGVAVTYPHDPELVVQRQSQFCARPVQRWSQQIHYRACTISGQEETANRVGQTPESGPRRLRREGHPERKR